MSHRFTVSVVQTLKNCHPPKCESLHFELERVTGLLSRAINIKFDGPFPQLSTFQWHWTDSWIVYVVQFERVAGACHGFGLVVHAAPREADFPDRFGFVGTDSGRIKRGLSRSSTSQAPLTTPSIDVWRRRRSWTLGHGWVIVTHWRSGCQRRGVEDVGAQRQRSLLRAQRQRSCVRALLLAKAIGIGGGPATSTNASRLTSHKQ